jgi:hypothetical protein
LCIQGGEISVHPNRRQPPERAVSSILTGAKSRLNSLTRILKLPGPSLPPRSQLFFLFACLNSLSIFLSKTDRKIRRCLRSPPPAWTTSTGPLVQFWTAQLFSRGAFEGFLPRCARGRNLHTNAHSPKKPPTRKQCPERCP